MDTRFKPAMDAAHAGDLAAFRAALAADPGLLTAPSATSHPNLMQFVVVDGGIDRIAEPLPFLEVLLEAGVDPAIGLVAAASVNARALVERLLEAGADIETGAPWTALEEALYWGHQDMGRHLIEEHGARIASLRAAAQLGRLDLVERYFDADGALMPEAGRVVFPFGKVVKEAHAVINQALFLALRVERYDVAEFLLARGGSLNTIVLGHHEHCTPLHQAVYLNQPETIDWLLDRGAHADIDDARFNNTPIQWARHFGRDELARQIEARIHSASRAT